MFLNWSVVVCVFVVASCAWCVVYIVCVRGVFVYVLCEFMWAYAFNNGVRLLPLRCVCVCVCVSGGRRPYMRRVGVIERRVEVGVWLRAVLV